MPIIPILQISTYHVGIGTALHIVEVDHLTEFVKKNKQKCDDENFVFKGVNV